MTFSYGEYVEDDKLAEHERTRFDVWLCCRYNKDITKLVRRSRNKRLFETVVRVVVKEYDIENDIVWVEIWCKNIFNTLFNRHRYNVFYVTSKPNPYWSCEGDFGKGLIK